LPSGWGTATPGIGRCKLHLGGTPTHRTHAGRVVAERAEAAALADLHRLGVPPMGNPLVALAELAAEAQAWAAIMRARVADLAALTVTDAGGVDHVRATVVLYERAIDRAAALAGMLARLGIDDRIIYVQQRITEAQARQLYGCMSAILGDLGVDHEAPDVRAVIVLRLRELVAGEVPAGDQPW
jgi:hypothetical protein